MNDRKTVTNKGKNMPICKILFSCLSYGTLHKCETDGHHFKNDYFLNSK